MQNKIIVAILSGFILVDVLLIYLALTISPIKLKRTSFVYEYGEEIPVNIDNYVNANESVLENVKLDLSHVSTEVGTYKASIEYFGEKQNFEIQIVDTIKPKAQLKKVQFNIQVGTMIRARDLVETIQDKSQTTVYFYNKDTGEKERIKTYDFEGSYIERIIVEDDYGNQSAVLRVKIVVEMNRVLPVIQGVDDLEIKVGETVDLLKGISAIDDLEGNITSRMKIEGVVDNQTPGIYHIVYTVSDEEGNVARVVRKVMVVEDDN